MKMIPHHRFHSIKLIGTPHFSVCRATVAEVEDAVSKVDPKKKAEVGGYRLDSLGNAITRTVPLVKSEMFLTELFENICK